MSDDEWNDEEPDELGAGLLYDLPPRVKLAFSVVWGSSYFPKNIVRQANDVILRYLTGEQDG